MKKHRSLLLTLCRQKIKFSLPLTHRVVPHSFTLAQSSITFWFSSQRIHPHCCLIDLVFARGAKATCTTLRAVQRLKQNQEPYKLVSIYNFMGTTPEDWNSNAVQPLKEKWKIVYMYTTPLLQQFTRFIMHTNITYSQTFRGEWIVQNYKSIWSVIHAKARKWQH